VPKDVVPVRWRTLTFFFTLLVVCSAVLCFYYNQARFSHGTWDAWAIWNLRAHFLSTSGTDLYAAFAPSLAWSHPDYPLLLPTLVARLCDSGSVPGGVGPRALAAMFTFVTALLLVGSIAKHKGLVQGLLAMGALLSCQTFLYQGASQCADIPMSFYILLTFSLALLACGGDGWQRQCAFVFIGPVAVMVAWTKNEGILFLLALIITSAWMTYRHRTLGKLPSRAVQLLCASILPIITLVYFKLKLAPQNDLVSGLLLPDNLEKIISIERHLQLIGLCLKGLLTFGGWPISLFLILLLVTVLVRKTVPPSIASIYAFGWMCMAIVFTGYYLVYLVTPHNLAWHVETSWHRLLSQYFPSILMFLFLVVDTPWQIVTPECGDVELNAS
ncbi:hypothetical protein BVX99_03420, partial [bacterium F16]